MACRPDPLRLYAAAHLAGLTQRLVREARISEESAERWMGVASSPAWLGRAHRGLVGPGLRVDHQQRR